MQRWPETKRLLGLLVNSSGGAHARNARRLIHASRKQDRRLAAALLAAALAHTPRPRRRCAGRVRAWRASRRRWRGSCCATSPNAARAATSAGARAQSPAARHGPSHRLGSSVRASLRCARPRLRSRRSRRSPQPPRGSQSRASQSPLWSRLQQRTPLRRTPLRGSPPRGSPPRRSPLWQRRPRRSLPGVSHQRRSPPPRRSRRREKARPRSPHHGGRPPVKRHQKAPRRRQRRRQRRPLRARAPLARLRRPRSAQAAPLPAGLGARISSPGGPRRRGARCGPHWRA